MENGLCACRYYDYVNLITVLFKKSFKNIFKIGKKSEKYIHEKNV